MAQFTIGERRVYGFTFSDPIVAERFARRCFESTRSAMSVVLGEIDEDGNGEVFVVTRADAARAERAGFAVIY